MQDESKYNGKKLSCSEFDALLIDALDGVMSGQDLADFRAHAESCMDCGPLFANAEAGMKWMKSLEEVEPPTNLVHNILAATSMKEPQLASATASKKPSWLRRAGDWISPSLAPAIHTMMQPRFAMTAATAFFSVSMLLNVSGVKLKDLGRMDLRPSAISTSASMQYHQTTARVVKYYENIRFVYAWESKMKALKDAAGTPADSKQEQNKQKDQNNKKSRGDQEQNENYSLEKGEAIIARLDQFEMRSAPIALQNRRFL